MEFEGPFGGLNQDLSDFLGENKKPDLKFSFDNTNDADMLKLSQLWSFNRNTNLFLQPNDEELRGVVDSSYKEDAEREHKINLINIIKMMMMRKCSREELSQFIKSNFSSRMAKDDPNLRNLTNEFGLLGFVYVTADPFQRCNKFGDFLRENKIKVNLIKASDKCTACVPLYDGRCPKANAEIVQEIPYGEKLYDECKGKLILSGRISSDTIIDSKQTLAKAFLAEPDQKQKQPIFTQRFKKAEKVINIDEAKKMLNKEALDSKAREDKKSHREFLLREVRPIARMVEENVLKGVSKEIYEPALISKLFNEERVKYAIEKTDIPLVRTRVLAHPVLYSKCEDLRDFLHKHGIRILNADIIPRCSSCRPHRNGNRCSLLSCKLVNINNGMKIDLEDRLSGINELYSKKYISSNEAKNFRELEKQSYLKGLRAAFQAIDSEPKRSKTAKTDFKDDLNAFVLSTGNFADRENAVLSTRQALAGGICISKIKNILAKKRKDPDVIRDAIAGLKNLAADTLDDCMIEAYVFDSRIIFNKGDKCNICKYGKDSIVCRRHNLVFSSASVSIPTDDDEVPGSDIIDTFKGCNYNGNILVDPEYINEPLELDIEKENPGKDLPVSDIVGNITTDHTDYEHFFDGSGEMSVDIDPPPKKGNDLDIDDLSTGNMDLGDFLS